MGKEARRFNDSATQSYAVLAYFSVLCICLFPLAKKDSFVKFHVKQGMILALAEFVFCLFVFLPLIGDLLFSCGMMLCCVFSIAGVIKVFLKEQWEMPIIHDLTGYFPFPF